MDPSSSVVQMEAEKCVMLQGLVEELGGLAHSRQSSVVLERLVDNLLSHGIPPSGMSENLMRWIHTHRNREEFKISTLLGGNVANKLAGIIPDCYGKYPDPKAPECVHCSEYKRCTATFQGNKPEKQPNCVMSYPETGKADQDAITEILVHKAGQVAKTLVRGAKVILFVDNYNKLRLAQTTEPLAKITVQEDTMAAKTPLKTKQVDLEDEEPVVKKPKKGAPIEEEEEELELELEDDELEDEEEAEDEDDEDEEEEEEVKPKAKAKPAKPSKVVEEPKKKPGRPKKVVEEEDEDEEEEEDEKPRKKAKKVKKEKPEEPAAVLEFRNQLKTTLKDDNALFKYAKKQGVSWLEEKDTRINRMRCVMACVKVLKSKK